ncbi:MAG: nickel-responsive transcriptional regulator NikR [Planctomycetia bacterium]|nr:nickel-responsive transcriptional regulator NikR [Planctomycetia bacterium]
MYHYTLEDTFDQKEPLMSGKGVTRITISVDEELLEKFDQRICQDHFPNRSEAFRSLIRDAIVRREWNHDEPSSDDHRIDESSSGSGDLAGTITLVYDHHHTTLLRQITGIQHEFGPLIICSQHAHLDHHHCMESIIVHGTRERIRELHRRLTACKGMKHTALSMTTTGRELA